MLRRAHQTMRIKTSVCGLQSGVHSVFTEYARSPYQTPHLAGASAPGWSTFTGGSEHAGPHVFFDLVLHDSTTDGSTVDRHYS